MNLCLLHGYLFEGSGSNIYVQNIAKAYCQLGHTVHVFCQERHLAQYDFVASYRQFNAANHLTKTLFNRTTPYPGKCHVYTPHLGPLLPVYVKDQYEYFKQVKTFPTLHPQELEAYLHKNIAALSCFLKDHRVDLIHAQHVMMSPTIAHQALSSLKLSIPMVITSHGSELNYSIKGHPHLKPYAVMGLKHAQAVFASSVYLKNLLLTEFKHAVPKLEEKIQLIPCGVNTREFKPVYDVTRKHIAMLEHKLKQKLHIQKKGKTRAMKEELKAGLRGGITSIQSQYDIHHLDQDCAQSLKQIAWGKDRVILYIGKFMKTKGPQVVVKTLLRLVPKMPQLKCLFIGFGRDREYVESLVYQEKKLDNRVYFTGLLEHEELKHLLPLGDILVVPSLFPESFGMIAAEGMACGVPTLVTYQSGLKDMHDTLQSILDKKKIYLKKMPIGNLLPLRLSANIEALFKRKLTRNRSFKKALHLHATQHFDWSQIAKRVLTY